MRLAILLTTALAWASVGAAQDTCRAVAIPGGVADQNTAFVTRPEGAVEAFDVRTGRSRWRSKTTASPVGTADGELVAVDWSDARPNVMRVLTLNETTGAMRVTSPDVELPHTVARARLDPGGIALLAHPAAERLVIDWQAIVPVTSGAHPGDARAGREAGTVEIDSKSGRIVATNAGPVTERPAGLSSSMPYRHHGRYASGPWRLGDTSYALTMSTGDDGSIGISLQRAASPPILLVNGRAPQAWLSPDAAAVFVRTGTGSADPVVVFDVATAKRIGAVKYEPAAGDYAVGCGLVFFAVDAKAGRILKAAQLDGRELWSRPIVDRPRFPTSRPR